MTEPSPASVAESGVARANAVVSPRLFAAWVSMVCQRRRLVLAICVGLTILAVATIADRFAISTDTDDLISPDLAYRQAIMRVNAAFPGVRDRILVVIDSHDEGHAMDAARILADQMRTRPDLFADVSALHELALFRRNGLLFKDEDSLESLVDRMSAAQPFLGSLTLDPSLRGLFDLLATIARHGDEANTLSGAEVFRLFDSVADITEAANNAAPGTLSWSRLIGDDTDETLVRRFISVTPTFDFSSLRPANAAIEALRGWVETYKLTPVNGIRVRLTDEAVLNDEELQSVSIGMGMAGLLSLVAVIVLLAIAFHSPRTTAAALITLLVGLVWTAAFAFLTIGTLNLISVAFAVLFIGLSVDFSIHFALRYREVARKHLPQDGLAFAAAHVGGALSLAALAAAIGFLSFLPTAYTGLAELGVIAAAGMGIALLLTFTLLPALIMVIRPRMYRPIGFQGDLQNRLERGLRTYARPVTVLGGALVIGCASLVPQAYFDFDPLNLKDPSSESVTTLIELMDEAPAYRFPISILAEDLETAEQLAVPLSALPTVGETRTLMTFVPTNQDAKLNLVTDLRWILGPSLSAAPAPPPSNAEIIAAGEDLLVALDEVTEHRAVDLGDVPMPVAGMVATTFSRELSTLLERAATSPAVLADLHTRLLGTLPSRLEDLAMALNAAPVGIDDVPPVLRDQWITSDGRALLQVFPAEPVHRDRDALQAFVTSVQTLAPEAGGAPVGIYEGGRAVVEAFLEAAVIAVAAIALLLVIMFRNLRDTLIVFAPLILAALMTVALSVLIPIPFNFANVIVLPLLFGLGVAGSLHLVIRERKQTGGATAMGTSTPRAVLFSALTTIATFGSLSLSAHQGTASMGLLLTVSITLVLVCTLVFLPALLALRADSWRLFRGSGSPETR